MPAFYGSTIDAFLTDDVDRITGILIAAIGQAGFESHHNKQTLAWHTQIEILKKAFMGVIQSGINMWHWHVFLEYSIPRRQKRIDVIIIADDLIYVIEFKIGAQKYDSSARKQLEDYALDLRDFHAESRHRVLVPILVATKAATSTLTDANIIDDVAQIVHTNGSNLATILSRYSGDLGKTNTGFIDAAQWNHSTYQPVPTIIEAAEMLYAGQSVREISSSRAGLVNLTETTDRLVEAIRWAQENKQKAICFVTGIPGAGKTLTGLNVVHNPEMRADSRTAATFLSGNGPLVSIVREALAQDDRKRNGTTLAIARHNVSTFIQNVHSFIEHFIQDTDGPPNEHVVIFDEAQRAWNAEKELKKYGRNSSEPAIMLSVMDRHLDWSVVIALVGGGQEIHNGEAGLSEWGKALLESYRHWQVYASPEVLVGGVSLAGNRLFSFGVPDVIQLKPEPSLHLGVSIRTYKSDAVAHWVNAVISGNSKDASTISKSIVDYPIRLTRSLSRAKSWLGKQTRGSRRSGIVASSEAKRLRPYGIEVSSQFRQGIKFEQWFLFDKEDVRSSYQLEVAATEFECQGLELDWTCVCWDGDLAYDLNVRKWTYRHFSGRNWQIIVDSQRQQYWLNKYRVLLTRAREGFIIWVPPGEVADKTLLPQTYDSTAQYLTECGITEI